MPSTLRPHTAIATVAEPTLPAALASLANLPAGTDLAEVRLDFLWSTVPDVDAATDQLLALVDAAPLPLLATLRPKRQGGRFEGPENVRVGLLQAALQAGFQHADIELDVLSAGGVAANLTPHGGLVASQHSFGEMPCRSDGLQILQSMQDFHPQLDKFAVHVGAFNDTLRVLEFARSHAARGGHPALAPLGLATVALRAILPFAGNRATYGAAGPAKPTVPGQPALADIQAVWTRWGLAKTDLDHLAEQPRPWLAVLGIPVQHSMSPALHNAALKSASRPERFGALEVPASSSALRLVLHVAPRIGMVGASVTAPHKLDAARIATCDAAAKAVGAANCLRFVDDRVEATNTDASALARLLKPVVTHGAPALVLGAGGAARAAVHALAGLGANVTVASRDSKHEATFAVLGARWISWSERATTGARIVVNATPIGSERTDPNPLPASVLSVRPHVVELVYAAGPTQLQRDAVAAGCNVTSGRTVLLEQGVDAYRYWFGVEPNRSAMQSTLGASA